MAKLMNVKEKVDNTFEYTRGLGRMTEEAFHSILKSELKSPRYQLKKCMIEGNPKHLRIQQDHSVNLSELIIDERKVLEAEKMSASTADMKRLFAAGGFEEL